MVGSGRPAAAMSNILLALDQSSQTSGYSVFTDGKLTDYGKFTFSDSDVGARLTKIRNKVIQLLDQYNITNVAFEDIQLQANRGNNVVTFKTLAEVYGVIHQLLDEKQIPYQIVSSVTWKSTLGIKGADRTAQKKNAQLYVLNTYNLKVDQDTTDAICIGESCVKKSTCAWED